MPLRDRWPARLHVVTGKGGTGKTTVAAALAIALATDGRRTLLVEVEGRHGIAQLAIVRELQTEGHQGGMRTQAQLLPQRDRIERQRVMLRIHPHEHAFVSMPAKVCAMRLLSLV